MEQGLTDAATQQPAPTLKQLAIRINFNVEQGDLHVKHACFYYLEAGRQLIQAKAQVPYGEWGQWLKENCTVTPQSAATYMKLAARYSDLNTCLKVDVLTISQAREMLALPADETEKFIEAKAAEGTPVEDMTVKQLREEVQKWKSKAEDTASVVSDKERRISQMALDFNRVSKERSQLQSDLDKAQNQLRNQKPIVKAPEDYEQIKRDVANLRNEKVALQKKLDAAVRNVEVPADYHANKKRLTELDAKIASMQKQIDAKDAELQRRVTAEEYYATAQKLDTISALVKEIIFKKELGAVIDEYRMNKRDRFEQILALFSDFVRSYRK